MDFIAYIAERKIREAMEKGEFDNLPGAGRPLVLEDWGQIPPELRMAWKILKNSGCLPAELADRREAASLLEMLDNCPDEAEKTRQIRKLRCLVDRMGMSAERHRLLEQNDEYYMKILGRLEAHERGLKAEKPSKGGSSGENI